MTANTVNANTERVTHWRKHSVHGYPPHRKIYPTNYVYRNIKQPTIPEVQTTNAKTKCYET